MLYTTMPRNSENAGSTRQSDAARFRRSLHYMSLTELELYRRNAAHLEAHGLYDRADEHDACGVGLIAALDGKPRREVVLKGVEALKAVWHRGAVDAAGKTGDGAGIHVQIPHAFIEDFIRKGGQELNSEKFAVGQIFLPRTDLGKQARCRVIVAR